MSESTSQFQLRGWQAVVGLIVIVAIAAVRLSTMDDNMGDTELLKKLEFQLMTEHFPSDVESLKSAYASGDMEMTSELVESITTSKITITSVSASSPLLSFSTNQKTVVKVTYSLDDSSGNRTKGTKYYRFKHGGFGNSWSYEHESGAIAYYLNFL